jgi:hypothetical protein
METLATAALFVGLVAPAGATAQSGATTTSSQPGEDGPKNPGNQSVMRNEGGGPAQATEPVHRSLLGDDANYGQYSHETLHGHMPSEVSSHRTSSQRESTHHGSSTSRGGGPSHTNVQSHTTNK